MSYFAPGGTSSEFYIFSLKARLEKEAEEKIALVVERAHNQAIVWVPFLCYLLLFFHLFIDVLKYKII